MKEETKQKIQQNARDFVRKWIVQFEKQCNTCNFINCKDNKTCMQCGCQF